MTIQAATPYLMLNGKTEQAIELYRSALRATPEAVHRFGDMDGSCPEALRSRVMHASMRIGTAQIMMSDGPMDAPPMRGGTVSVALALDDADETRRGFDALAASGTVIQPLMDAPWGSLFGVVIDEFGVSWMFDCAKRST